MESELTNIQRNSETCFSLLNHFFKQKIPFISPLFHQNRIVTDFKEKAKLEQNNAP